jgi:hypothetical protein
MNNGFNGYNNNQPNNMHNNPMGNQYNNMPKPPIPFNPTNLTRIYLFYHYLRDNWKWSKICWSD